ncbi:MAG: urate hydroxylase PuuD [Gammaproteobacteria bacterium]|nr:urate hydroxylase PuuD [Gammaproteobacteria bacterium]MBU1655282.1 urate hydroxylase PuuD [Gammaproteobacteria bacterium]MBU1962061.1 urate hydroxylase PuuD [Gammaproteobacteria bacterium]
MNPLETRGGTIIAGIVLAVIFIFLLGPKGAINLWEVWVWFHVIVGIAWVGLLYYFNFVQIPAVAQAIADKEPGPAAINKYIAPRALFWFRWAAVATWLSGSMALEALHSAPGSGVMAAFSFQPGFEVIGMGAWLGTIMLFNVWVLIWPNQKKLLGMTPATDEQKASAKRIAFLASRTNSMLSIPMLLGMTAFAHGMPF